MEEIEKNAIDVAEGNGFTLTEPIDFTHEKKVVHWSHYYRAQLYFHLSRLKKV
jgi:hypothetical protein